MDAAEVLAQRLPRDLGERAGQLDAGRPAADDDERQQPPLPAGVGFALGRFERQQHPPPHLERIVERLEAGARGRPFRMTEVGVRRAGREHEVVVRRSASPPSISTRRAAGSIARTFASSTSTFF